MPMSAHIRSWLPLAILLVALASAIALGGDRGYLYRWRVLHSQLTTKNLAVVGNMSPQHNFRLAASVWRDEDGGFEYDLYGRFPVGGYALIKLAVLPFGNSLAARILAARVLMLLMFCGAAVFAYLALARIAGSRWIALAAVLLAFSGFYAIYLADSVAGETAMDMLGAALVFHGMAAFVQEGRFRQLLIKTCAALLLGWHAYALIMPFIALGFGGEAFALVRSALASGGGTRAGLSASLRALARSRFIALAAVSILFGSALLALNLANEYTAYGGEKSLSELPSLDSAIRRMGMTDHYEDWPDWTPGNFLRQQLHRAGLSSAPYAVLGAASGMGVPLGAASPAPHAVVRLTEADYYTPPLEPSPTSFGWDAWGIAAAIAALALAALAVPRRFRLPMASAALMGFCWAVAARGNAFEGEHSYEGLFYFSLPLALWGGALIAARRLMGERRAGALAIGMAALAAPALALSSFQAAQIRWDEYAARHEKEIMADMDAIREITSGKSVILSADAWRAAHYYGLSGLPVEYYLAGSHVWEGAEPVLRGDEATWARVWRNYQIGAKPDPRGADAEYAIVRYRNESAGLLTPANRRLFLYKRSDLAELYRAERRRLEASEPAARAAFDVYLEEGALRYLKSPCAPGDADALFFAHFFPANGAYPPGDGDYAGFEGVNFPFAATNNNFNSSGVYFDGACMTTVNIPYYPVAAIRTGQYVSDSPLGRGASEEDAWEVSIFPPPSAETLALYESAYQAVVDSEPAAQSGFDIYLDADSGAISYLKRPCSDEDARGRFFLSVYPANIADLPAERRELGHESLNFDFEPPHGVVFNGKCMATIQLPDYEIAKMETGQWVPGGERLWDAEIAVGD